ncbi:MAG TPA: glycosyltransferase family 4 protein [Spirochaetales bacterium]|nr:glycosyltransferase family 4 protein [Spirochaetales bacterium]HOV38596.1 glycosyltransferase family 4 protein [Spirochaetales bacterium]
MYVIKTISKIEQVGFISTRFQGIDGVSLETRKWVHVFESLGFETYFFSGLSDWYPERSMVIPEAFFNHPEILEIQDGCFGKTARGEELTGKIQAKRKILKEALYEFIRRWEIDLLVIENAVTIPINIPFGLAITEVIAETGIPAIAHHHDFVWERQRFSVSAVNDYITMAFPPDLPPIMHVTINTEARRNLSYRRGISSIIVPNVFDYSVPPPGIDEYNSDLREALGIGPKDVFVLQPTRIVARKGIESAIELVHRMKKNLPSGKEGVKLVISHQARDEGTAYYDRIIDYAHLLGVDLIIRPDRIGEYRQRDEEGRKIYSLFDVYPHADFVTYPSTYEGFGNAFLEAIYFKKPLLVNRYSIFQTDIEPVGFKVVIMDTYITDETVKNTWKFILDEEFRTQSVEHNFELGARYFSYTILAEKIKSILLNFGLSLF